ncbi:MAG: tyrosine-type recombinase/integrase [Pseudomonadota bacterium]
MPWFVEYVGAGTDIRSVNKNHVKQIRDKLVGRLSGLPSTTYVFDIPEASGKDQVSKTTARNEFGSICKFLRWCASDGYIDVAPTGVEGIAKAPASESGKVRPFEPKEVNLIFSSPVFAGCKNKRQRYLPGPHIMKNEVYWALLLLLFTGARTSDIAALYVEDVQLEHEIPHLRFRMREGNLKESASERDTPLHPELLEFGFAGFVDQRHKQDPSGLLFGRMKRKQELRETLNKRLNGYRKAIGLDYDKLVMHSFRRGMIDALANSGCPESIAERFVGHAISTVHGKYGKGLSLEAQLKFLLEVKLHLTDETKNILRKPANA